MAMKRVLFWLIVTLQLYFTDGLECYSCSNVSHVSECLTTITCSAGQICHTATFSKRFTLGCKHSELCPIAGTSTPGEAGVIVGRALTRVSSGCSECCSTGMCNRQLCQNNDPTCHDSGNIDCASTGSFVNLCAATGHLKQECRRFCGFCSMVEGAWSNWSAWSSCSATCGDGTVSRTRSCTNPAPADGGSDCIGDNNDINTCSNAVCPVNGGWSGWSPWGSCSVTCGIGMQRRDRSCSHPYPSNSGEHCFGDARDDQICVSRACQDGGWTNWGGWTACSKTCDTGTRQQSRSCTNPSPSILGRSCTGNNIQVDTCTVTPCHAQQIGFTVNNPKDAAPTGHITFTTVVTNQGDGYSTTTGKFTCTVAGVYSFSLTITKTWTAEHAYCSIYKNHQLLGKTRVDENGNYIGNVPGSTTVYVHLLPGDIVFLQGCSAASSMFSGNGYSTFTGYLIHAD